MGIIKKKKKKRRDFDELLVEATYLAMISKHESEPLFISTSIVG